VEKVKYLIIGAGVSGLGFANFIHNKDYLIIEKEDKVGGYCKTIYKDEFVWDYAGHFFHFADPEIKKFFQEKINSESIVYKEKNTKVFYKGRLIDYPFQKNIHQLPQDEFIDCLYDLYFRPEKNEYKSFKEMLYGKFGSSISEKFLIPYNEKLYACDLDMLDENAMGRFFPYANITEIIANMKKSCDNSYNNNFLYPKKGAVTFVNALLEDLDQNRISLGEELLEVDIKNKKVLTNKRVIEYEYLINTSPFDKFLNSVDSKLYEELKKYLSYNKVLVFNMGFDKGSIIDDVHWIYVPDEDINFYRVGFYNNILEQEKLSIYVEIGYSSKADIDEEQQLKLTLENLRKMGIIDSHQLVAYSTVIMDPAYVHISRESQKIKKKYISIFNQMNVYSIGRYGDWKYCSIEDSIKDAKNLANMLNEIEFIGAKHV
jgi:protoporphyrinogen oxidase